ncbi:MAG TPA: hypothetical protein VLJ42_04940 [Solirubrobacteraceae bacterium]|nr:hypothetical protein [Solirubrobacteraceae bacterium]
MPELPSRRNIVASIAANGVVRLLLVALAVALIVVHGIWPVKFEVDSASVALVVVIVVVALFPWLESADLPGGGKLKFRHKLDEFDAAVETLTVEASATVDGDADDVKVAARREAADGVVAEVLDQAAQSPKLAIMLLSSELDRELHRLLMGTGWGVQRRLWNLREGIARLVEVSVIPASATYAADLFTQIRNEVVHGAGSRSDDEILRAIDSGIEMYNAVANVRRERNFVLYVNVPIFSDDALTVPITDGTAVFLRTVAPTAQKTETERIFPTTRTDFKVGEEVAWLWDNSKQWGEAWCKHPATGDIIKPWDGSLNFIGSPIDQNLPQTG